jgi:hypothetical protein
MAKHFRETRRRWAEPHVGLAYDKRMRKGARKGAYMFYYCCASLFIDLHARNNHTTEIGLCLVVIIPSKYFNPDVLNKLTIPAIVLELV